LSHSFGGRKKQKKTKKNNCKTYTHPPPTGRRLRKQTVILAFITYMVILIAIVRVS